MNNYTRNWLFTLCKAIGGIDRAVIFLKASEQNGYLPASFFPEKSGDYQELTDAAKTALSKGEDIVLRKNNDDGEAGEPVDILAIQLKKAEAMFGVVVLQMGHRIAVKHQAIVEYVKDSFIWLDAVIQAQAEDDKQPLVTTMELVATCLEHDQYAEAGVEVATELANRLQCERVSIGFLAGSSVRIAAVSHSAGFDHKTNLIRDLAEAMYEAISQESSISYPFQGDELLVTRCHEKLVSEHDIARIFTVPFVAGGKVAGAVVFERSADTMLDKTAQKQLEHIVSIVGPVLDIRRKEEQGFFAHLVKDGKRFTRGITGSGHLGLKFGVGFLCILMAALSLISGEYKVTSDARLEAHTQRVVVAPQDGYIAQTGVRPGDIVRKDDILGALDDKELNLELKRITSQLEQYQTEYRDALAQHDRSKVSIINAKKNQAEARLTLINEQLQRTRLTAPFDGFIVSGDLSQALGSPVERGQVLFMVAPLEEYRVMLQVDERDIGAVNVGQQGNLVLSGLPRQPLGFTVEKITPVSVAEEGRNYFQVEAKMAEKSDLLRPGMEGVAKIEIEERKLIWIMGHRLINWIRLTLWTYLP